MLAVAIGFVFGRSAAGRRDLMLRRLHLADCWVVIANVVRWLLLGYLCHSGQLLYRVDPIAAGMGEWLYLFKLAHCVMEMNCFEWIEMKIPVCALTQFCALIGHETAHGVFAKLLIFINQSLNRFMWDDNHNVGPSSKRLRHEFASLRAY